MNRLYSETEIVASVEGLTMTRLRAFVAARCVIPARGGDAPGARFDDADVARLRLLAELGEDFDLDEEAAAMVMSLIDQIHGLRRQLRALGEAVGAEPEDVRARVRDRIAASVSP